MRQPNDPIFQQQEGNKIMQTTIKPFLSSALPGKRTQHERPLEQEVHRDLEGQLTYAGYLHLDRLLSAQHPLSCLLYHDETLSSSSIRSLSCGSS
jgi:hypothetical protein